ncbi:MAG: DUF4430 domain-containing protein [Lachnospiraceae bacterium]
MNPKIRKLIIAALAVLTLAGVVLTTTIKPASDQSATGNPTSQETVLGQTDPEENADLDDSKDGLTQDESDAQADEAEDEANATEEDSDGKSGKDTNSDSGKTGAAVSGSTTGQSGSTGSSSGSTGQGSSFGSSAGQSSSSKQETITCTITIDCSLLTDESVLQGTGNENKQRYVPTNGKIAYGKSVKVKKGSSVYDVLKKFCRANDIQLEASFTAGLDTYYVEGINHLYEFDGGEGSGWVYFVNGQSPNYGASDVEVKDGDKISWMYTLDYGNDVTP